MGLYPLWPATLPDLAGPAFRFAVICSRFAKTNPCGEGLRWGFPSVSGTMMFPAISVWYEALVEVP